MIDVVGHEEPGRNPFGMGHWSWFAGAVIVQVAILSWLLVSKPEPLPHKSINHHRAHRAFFSVFDL
jgi:hypothetical protein